MQPIKNYTNKYIQRLFTIFIRLSGSLLQLIVNLVLASFFGASATGQYNTFIGWVTFLGLAGTLGSGANLIRNAQAANDRSLLFTALSICAIIFLVILLLPASVIFGPEEGAILAISAFFFSFVRVICDHLRAKHRALKAVIFEFCLPPFFFLSFLFILNVLGVVFDKHYYTLALIFTLLPLMFIPKVHFSGYYDQLKFNPEFLAGALPLFSVLMVNTYLAAFPYIVLSNFISAGELGVFAVCHRLVAISATISGVLSAIYAPLLRLSWVENKVIELDRQYKNGNIFSLLCYIPLLIVFIFFGKELLGIFGEEFSQHAYLLLILAVPRLLNVALGLQEIMLIVKNREKFEIISVSVVSVVLTVIVISQRADYEIYDYAKVYACAFAAKPLLSYFLNKMSEVQWR